MDYFQRLYSLDDVEHVVETLPTEGFMALTHTENENLSKPFSEEEIESAVRAMERFKALGPDGYQPVFYQKCWEKVGSSVTHFVLEFF